MKKQTVGSSGSWIRSALAWLAPSLLLLALAGSAGAAVQVDVDAIWNDPIFKKQFIGGYGINAEIEPRITPEEVVILEKVQPLMARDLPKAEAALKKAMKPDCSPILDFTLGGIQFQQDKYELALGNFLIAKRKFPSFRRAWRNLGLIYARQGNYDESINSFIRMIELGGGDAYAYGLLGFAYASKQDYQPAEAAYRNALLLQPDNTEWRKGLTTCVLRQGKFEDCAALLDVLIARYPDKAEFWLLQAHAYVEMKQPLKAAVNLEALVAIGKATTDSAYLLGDIYRTENLMDLAANAYERAIGIDLNQAPARPVRAAEILAARGASAQARKVARQIHTNLEARLEPADRSKLLKLEARLSMAEGDVSTETVAVLEEIVKLDPLDGEALMMLGAHFSRTNEPDRAMFYYERAASLAAFEVNAKIGHAQILVGMGRYADALPLLRQAQELKPREEVARYVEQVERMSKTRR